MDKATTASVLGTILGLVAGIGGMLLFSPQPADDSNISNRITEIASERDAAQAEREKAAGELSIANAKQKLAEQTARELADELSKKAEAGGDATDAARKLQDELDKQKAAYEEALRQKNARIEKLEGVLDDNGIFEYLSDEEIAARIVQLDAAFNTAFTGKDKKAAMQALWDLQKLGPKGYDKAIEVWKKLADDFGLEPWGEGPGELGLNMQEYVSLISSFGMIEYGLTNPDVDSSFRIASIYGLPWWSNEDAAKRAELAGNALMRGSGYESVAAVEALKDINDPGSTRYLADYVTSNSDNPAARKAAVMVLAQKNTEVAWAAIKDAAESDPDDEVKQAANSVLQLQNPEVAGVLINFVAEESQAALAGIRIGDILTSYNGVSIKTLNDINNAKKDVAQGASVQVIVRRSGKDVTLTLGPGQIGINGVAVTPKE